MHIRHVRAHVRTQDAYGRSMSILREINKDNEGEAEGGNATRDAHDESGSNFKVAASLQHPHLFGLRPSKSQVCLYFVGLFYDFSRRDFCISVCRNSRRRYSEIGVTIVTRPRASLYACTCVCTWLNREYS